MNYMPKYHAHLTWKEIATLPLTHNQHINDRDNYQQRKTQVIMTHRKYNKRQQQLMDFTGTVHYSLKEQFNNSRSIKTVIAIFTMLISSYSRP